MHSLPDERKYFCSGVNKILICAKNLLQINLKNGDSGFYSKKTKKDLTVLLMFTTV